jgi:predicted protein tyrosine phosphatase
MKILPAAGVNPMLYQRLKHSNVISVCRHQNLPIKALCARHCHIDCDDVRDEDLSDPEMMNIIRERRWQVPERLHIEQALEFGRTVDHDKLIILCAMGISRSPAIAWCLLLDKTGAFEAASAELRRLRPQARPNSLILRLGLEVLRDGSVDVLEVIRGWRSQSTEDGSGERDEG